MDVRLIAVSMVAISPMSTASAAVASVLAPPDGLEKSVAARDDAIQCVAQAISYEAGHESEAGQQAVAQVIMNRLGDPAYPKTACAVVYQGSDRRTGCQFTFTCDGSLARRKPGASWPEALRIAALAIDGHLLPTVGDALNYHASYVQPYWAAHLVRVAQIGAHIFYRTATNGGSPTRASGGAAGPRTVTLNVWGLAAATLTSVGGTVELRRN